ncbi:MULTISPECIES: hypothetical protein [Phenylobacterium]|uniref:DUF2059 domain-containing protein n=1 Tax=Phenylobacterium koreense TaxID=266125 RepID=A0ABV2EH85_9CAUL
MRHNLILRPLTWAILLAMAVGSPAAAEGPASRDAIAQEFRTFPLYQTIERRYPETYAAILNLMVDGTNRGRRHRDLVADGHARIVALLAEQAPKANVENTLRMAEITRDEARAVLAKDPATCLVLLGLRPHDIAMTDALPEALLKKEQAIMAQLLEQTAVAPEQTPVKALDDSAAEKLGIKAYDRLPDDQLRAAFLRIGGDPKNANDPVSQTAFCEFTIAMFDIILDMPPVEAAQIYKAFNALGAESATP